MRSFKLKEFINTYLGHCNSNLSTPDYKYGMGYFEYNYNLYSPGYVTYTTTTEEGKY
ncbi:hypothetical protein VCHA47P369_30495 [Vibrio chagasii]|nr:hypothetical protein VCHA31O73_30086 [Vibrio chagasii]CAH6992189.1 hypothetical protein VCHA48P435_10036 [Vibrio chagasii]CAH7027647.1 hypothetical protein VCHA35O143_50089 [Vibrio chagasii]CAH7051859.1 hypothetical protein VCHA51O448_10089 [Vibrio chagasii]CAH7177200.1 hypothetical protein VCHA47P369_30495 [Vibrio chagasii]